jgi:hypothetical protein
MFLLPFAGVGIVTAVTGLQRLARGDWHEGVVLTLFGVVFGGFAAAGVAAVIIGRRKLKEQDSLRLRHPHQAWLWRSDWSSGRIVDSSRGTLWASWIFASFWNLISFPVGFVGVREALQAGNQAGLVALLFPLVGIGLLTWAVRTTLRYQKYGISQLDLITIPGTIGRSIAGTVRVTSLLEPNDGFEVSLSCIRRVTTRSGKNSSTSESVLWQEERRVRGQSSRDSAGMGTRIPIAFAIPVDAQASDASNPRDQIVWRLKLSASVPGVDYESVFEVPVFRTSDSELPLTADEARMVGDQVPAPADYRQPPESRIAITRNRRGTEILFPAARNPGVAIGSTVFTLAWIAITGALVHYKAPTLFPIVFGLFALLLVVGTLQLWFEASRVRADGGTLALSRGYLYPGRERTMGVADIADVSIKIGMQAGLRPYYDVVIIRKDGKKVTAGRAVRDKREAEWLAVTLKNALGVRTGS